MTRARLSRRPLDCALREGFHILIMLSVCQCGMATETGKAADAAFDAGVVVLLKQELARQAQCADNPDIECNDAEVAAFLKLLDVYYPDKRSTPNYPRQAQQVGVNAVVVSELSIAPDGAVEGVEILSCESGEGDAGLKWKWKTDGEFCKQFSRATAKNFEGYRFPSVVHLAIDDSRAIQWRTTFVLEGSDSSDSQAQHVDLPTSDRRKINRFYKKQDWPALKEFALREQGTHPLYDYYIGYAAAQTGDKSAAVRHFKVFLEQTSASYFHYGAIAASVLIDEYYRWGDYDSVVGVADDHYDLGRYFGNQRMFSPAVVAQSMLFYGSALTLVSPPRIGEAVLTLQAVSVGMSVVEPPAVASSLEGVTNQQLTGLVSQIELLGARERKELHADESAMAILK